MAGVPKPCYFWGGTTTICMMTSTSDDECQHLQQWQKQALPLCSEITCMALNAPFMVLWAAPWQAPSFSPRSRECPGTAATYWVGEQKWQRIWSWLPSVTWNVGEGGNLLTGWIQPPKSFLSVICPAHLCRNIYNNNENYFVQLSRKENTEGTWFILQNEAYNIKNCQNQGTLHGHTICCSL